MKDSRFTSSVLTVIGKEISKEILLLCRVSCVLNDTKANNLISFNWESVLEEAKIHSPCLFKILFTLLKTRNTKKNFRPIIGLIVSTLCYFRNSSMNTVQKLI